MSAKNLESKIDELYELKAMIRAEMRRVNELKEIAVSLEEEIVTTMGDLALKKVGTDLASVSLSETIVPSADPEYWNDIRVWAIENDFQELLPRQLNQTSYRELLEMGIEVPHVEPFTKVKMSLRKTG